MKSPTEEGIATRQKYLKAYIEEYGITAAIEGTGLPLCDIRRAYTDPRPVYDHLVRVYQFYRGLAYQQSINDQGYF